MAPRVQATALADEQVKQARLLRIHAAAFLVLLAAAAAAFMAKRYGLPDLPTLPIESVRVGGELRKVSRLELEAAVSRHTAAGFFGVDVAAVRNAVLTLPWVAEVSVRRIWPDSIHLAIVERTADARWHGGGLVASDGTVFHPTDGTYPDVFPVLEGPEGTARQMLGRYRSMRRVLGQAGEKIERVGLTGRGLWWLRLDSGMTVVVGSQAGANLAQFARVFPALLGERMAEIERVDLRYTNGFAVRWKEPGIERVHGGNG